MLIFISICVQCGYDREKTYMFHHILVCTVQALFVFFMPWKRETQITSFPLIVYVFSSLKTQLTHYMTENSIPELNGQNWSHFDHFVQGI